MQIVPDNVSAETDVRRGTSCASRHLWSDSISCHLRCHRLYPLMIPETRAASPRRRRSDRCRPTSTASFMAYSGQGYVPHCIRSCFQEDIRGSVSMSVFGWAVGGWLFFNLVLVVALLKRRSRPLVREKLFQWVIGDRPFESPDQDHSQLKPRRHAPRAPMGTRAHHREGTSAKVLAALAVIGSLVAGSVIFVSAYPHSIAACAFGCK